MKLIIRLLTEMLEVRILPGEPKFFSVNNYIAGVEHSAPDRMFKHRLSIHIAEVAERPALRGALSRANKRPHKNVILAGRKILTGCRGTFGRVGQHYCITEDLSREESVHPALPRSGLTRS